MNYSQMSVSKEAATEALLNYKRHRASYDQRDWEIERIYRAISKGQTVISVDQSIRTAGFDERNRPKLAIARADDPECFCQISTGEAVFAHVRRFTQRAFRIQNWTEAKYDPARPYTLRAELPRIPPQHRPDKQNLSKYHLLWEADWVEIPRDPLLLKRLAKDAWLVCAAWDLTDVEVSVLRSHRNQ